MIWGYHYFWKHLQEQMSTRRPRCFFWGNFYCHFLVKLDVDFWYFRILEISVQHSVYASFLSKFLDQLSVDKSWDVMGTWWNMGHCGIWNGFRMFTCWFMAMNSNLQDGEVAWKHPGKDWTPEKQPFSSGFYGLEACKKTSVRAGVLSCFLSRFGQADDRRAKETEAFWKWIPLAQCSGNAGAATRS